MFPYVGGGVVSFINPEITTMICPVQIIDFGWDEEDPEE